ncbi:MAG TPA: hypothetical protein DCK95_11670 [Anaerolineaceae bacterium]|nr:hypothetical protein [Anaerolineaceae bacterium]
MLLFYVRHAQSANNALYQESGSYDGRNEDPPLSKTGLAQLPYMADFIYQQLQEMQADGQGGDRVTLYCSLMERTVATGSAIAQRCDLPLIGHALIHEAGGIYLKNDETGEHIGLPGKSKAYFAEHYPLLQYPQNVPQDGWWNKPHEEREERPARARKVLDDLLAKHTNPDEAVILVSHAEFFNHLTRCILDMPPDSNAWFEMMNCAVSLFDFQEGFIEIPYLNRHHFIPAELIT